MTNAGPLLRLPSIGLDRIPDPDLVGKILKAMVFIPVARAEDALTDGCPFEPLPHLATEPAAAVCRRLAVAVLRIVDYPDGVLPARALVDKTLTDGTFFGNDRLAGVHMGPSGPMAFLVNGPDGLCLGIEDASRETGWCVDRDEPPQDTLFRDADALLDEGHHAGVLAARRRLEWLLSVGGHADHETAAREGLAAALREAKTLLPNEDPAR